MAECLDSKIQNNKDRIGLDNRISHHVRESTPSMQSESRLHSNDNEMR